tara:strand:+ start:380 stop:1045 length:666 start_codon:yes stop_codon:yes gene_type:complete
MSLFNFFKPKKKPNYKNLRILKPISNKFGLDRGTPIDRIYIQNFLKNNSKYIKGEVCEVGDNFYTKFYGGNSCNSTIIGLNKGKNVKKVDLTSHELIACNQYDCFIGTQVLNFIYEPKLAVQGIHKLLKKDGIALITVSGIQQISKYDYDKWGDYWRFTSQSMKKIFSECFGENNIEVKSYGNVLTSISYLHGIEAEELTEKEIFSHDENYQLIISVKAFK